MKHETLTLNREPLPLTLNPEPLTVNRKKAPTNHTVRFMGLPEGASHPMVKPRAERTAVMVVKAMLMMTLHLFLESCVMIVFC